MKHVEALKANDGALPPVPCAAVGETKSDANDGREELVQNLELEIDKLKMDMDKLCTEKQDLAKSMAVAQQTPTAGETKEELPPLSDAERGVVLEAVAAIQNGENAYPYGAKHGKGRPYFNLSSKGLTNAGAITFARAKPKFSRNVFFQVLKFGLFAF